MRADVSDVFQLAFDRGGLGGELAWACIRSCGHGNVDRGHMVTDGIYRSSLGSVLISPSLLDCYPTLTLFF
jgi:hypothetical protein